MTMKLAKQLADKAGSQGRTYRHAWTSSQSKTPRHLRFGDGGELSYMRDGIVMTTNGHSGSYTRIAEFGGENRDEHEVEINIACDVFSGEDKLASI